MIALLNGSYLYKWWQDFDMERVRWKWKKKKLDQWTRFFIIVIKPRRLLSIQLTTVSWWENHWWEYKLIFKLSFTHFSSSLFGNENVNHCYSVWFSLCSATLTKWAVWFKTHSCGYGDSNYTFLIIDLLLVECLNILIGGQKFFLKRSTVKLQVAKLKNWLLVANKKSNCVSSGL